MTISETLGFLSLMGYLALFGQAIWMTRSKSKDRWGLYNHGFDKMPEVIKFALRHCLNGGSMVVADRNSSHRVLFRKYILRKGEIGLEFGFPDTEGARSHVPGFLAELTSTGTPFREAHENYGADTAIIHVDCGQDLNKAVELTRLCFFELFGLSLDAQFKSSPSGYSSVHDHVDDPRYRNPTASKWWSTFRARWRAQGHPDPNLLLKYAAFTVGLMFVCYPALWVTWFLADGASPEWRGSIGSVQVAGTHATWLLLLIYSALIVGFRRVHREVSQVLKPRPRTTIDRIATPLVFYALPLAVIASWFGI